ncbi:MAG: hypothetical protein HOP10_06840 [Chitinophagaceae bacterium]|nr:hypothetical protein [Chitinophagaceae bacterium]
MNFIITIKYFHPQLQIGLEDPRNAWWFAAGKQPVKINALIYQGQLYYRIPVSGKRISYKQLKKGLIKKQIIIQEEPLPF